MQTHPFFSDLVLHSDDELAQILGVDITERETIHEWPLSCVQKLLLVDGTKLIYKSQLPPTVEPQFYESATSTLLPGYQILGKLGKCDIMTLEWIDAPLLRDVAKNEAELVAHGREVIARIGQMRGDLPAYRDLGSAEKWGTASTLMGEKLNALIADGRFRLVEPEAAEGVAAWAELSAVMDKAMEAPRLIHWDLAADQIFVTDDGYRVIDWQRPMIAPPEVDLVTLLVNAGVEPRAYVNAIMVGIYWFLYLAWIVEAQHDLFTTERMPLLDQWAAKAVKQILGVG